MFDKLHHVNGNHDSDTVDSSESPVVKDIKPNLRKLKDAVKPPNIFDDWNSLAQFETFIELEMENLAAAKNHQNSNGTTTVSMKPNNNILKPEKHVRNLRFFSQNNSLIENYNHTPELRMENILRRFFFLGLFH